MDFAAGTGSPRAFLLPITAAATQPYANLTNRAGGATDEASLYPIGVLATVKSEHATVLACPPDVPRLST